MLPLKHASEGRRGYLEVLAKGNSQVLLREVLRHPSKGQFHSHRWFGWLGLGPDVPRHGDVDREVQLLDREIRQLVRAFDFLPTLRMEILQLPLESRANRPLSIFPGTDGQVPATRLCAPNPNQEVRNAIRSIQPAAG